MTFDIDAHLSAPRLSGLVLSPDGSRLVTTVATLAPDGKSFVNALWELDPAGERPARRLTRGEKGESGPVFGPDGGLLFRSARPDPEAVPDASDASEDEGSALWLLPADRGEARRVAALPAGVDGVAVARDSGDIVMAAQSFPTAGDGPVAADAERAKARKDAGVSAVLWTDYPIRHWDHELGPREPHLFALPAPDLAEPPGQPKDLTPAPGRALDDIEYDVTPDGSTVMTTWLAGDEPRRRFPDLVAIDVASGQRRTLLSGERTYHSAPACSPDGRWVVCLQQRGVSLAAAFEQVLVLVELATGAQRDLAADLDRYPSTPVWAPDSSAVYITADDGGRCPIWRVPLSGELVRLTGDGAYSDVAPSPDGRQIFALRSSYAGPPEPVVLDARAADQDATPLPGPAQPLQLGTRLEEVEAKAADGTRVRSWLVLPESATAADPAPLVLWIHGGPVSSWNSWSWRWNPHLLAARGYAVLLPDPALSTGYGRDFVSRGWGRWGAEPYTDLMSALDAALERDDLDGTRTAAMGGSFGGYMANWVAGHTDRFRAIITHASLWALEQFHGTTDLGSWWEQEFGDPYTEPSRYLDNSPHRFIGAITTPMLVVHGDKDYRVPVGEGLRLFTDLRLHAVDAQFLYFPDENHWVRKPGNARVWYETVFAFLDTHVLGSPWERPALL